MTFKKLTQYYELQKKIWDLENTVGSLRAAAESITPKLTEMPKSPNLQERLSRYVALIVDTEAKIAHLKPIAAAKRANIEKFANSIEDSLIKIIISLRFLECMTWVEVAEAVGGENTDDGVRIICQRYLEETK